MRLLGKIVALTLLTASAANAQPLPTGDAWAEDLSVLRTQLEDHHFNLYHTVSEQALDDRLNTLLQRSPHLSDEERTVELMKLVQMIGDGHTVLPLWHADITQYPLRVSLVEDVVLVTGVTEAHAHLLGSRLTKINSVPVTEIQEKFSEIVPFTENEFSERIRVGMYMLYHELLVGTGILENNSPALFTFNVDGETQEIELSALDRGAAAFSISNHLSSRHPDNYFKKITLLNDNVWFGANQETGTVYIHMSSYAGHSEMDEFATSVVEFIHENTVEHLIIDLRHNFGGDFFVGLRLASYLNLADSIDWRDGVYVLSDNVTFSAAMSNTAQFKQILNARQIGEPTGARPCGPQDMGQFTLPNSELLVTYSKRYFCFVKTDENTIMPDVRIDRSVDDYTSKKDSVLEWVMNDIASSD